MPGPPPPPPMAPMGPPPPPMTMSPAKKPAASSGGSGDTRGALLSQIQMGSKLKKVTTVDKSKPLGAGHIAGESSPVKSSSSRGVTLNKSSPDSSSSSPVSNASSRGPPPGGFASLTDELQHKLTLKKNKQSPVKEVKKEVRDQLIVLVALVH